MGRAGMAGATAVLTVLAGVGGWASGSAVGSSVGGAVAGELLPVPVPAAAALSPVSVPGPGAPSPDELLAAARRATVRLGLPGGVGGSGTIVSPDGLVLTNAHVGAPQAPGLAALYGTPFLPADPRTLLVSVHPDGAGAAVPTYRATPVVADGYSDLAVLRIDALADGRPLPEGERFPWVALGSAADLAVGSPLTRIGHPLGGGGALAVLPLQASAFLPDPQGRVPGERWELGVSGPVGAEGPVGAGGSGGAVLDAAGRLVGVPGASPAGADYAGRVRSADLARPLLDLAAAGAPVGYVSPYVVPGTGEQAGTPQGWGPADAPCRSLTAPGLPTGTAAAGAVLLSGMTPGEDLLVRLHRTGGGAPVASQRSTWQGSAAAGCLAVAWRDVLLEPGGYTMRVYAGPLLRPVALLPLVVGP